MKREQPHARGLFDSSMISFAKEQHAGRLCACVGPSVKMRVVNETLLGPSHMAFQDE